ncbi:hypothetical protein GCM10018952_72660 [Streptosporangium vulgare]
MSYRPFGRIALTGTGSSAEAARGAGDRLLRGRRGKEMTVIGIVLLVAGLVVGAALTLADPVLLSRINRERAE